jgi:hypothetical protein
MICTYIVQFSEDHASSVIIRVEDVWDAATLLVLTNELLLDTFYRTFERLQTLMTGG